MSNDINDKDLYTYIMFEEFWNKYKEFIKLQIECGALLDKSSEEGIKRTKYYKWLAKICQRNFLYLTWNYNYNYNKNDFEDKVKNAVWLTFNLLINKCDGTKEWGRVSEVSKIIIHILCGNESRLPYNAMGYMFMILASDISIQAIYSGLNLLSKEGTNKYYISDYSEKGGEPDPNSDLYKYNVKRKGSKGKNDVTEIEDLTLGTIVEDLKCRFSSDYMPSKIENKKNIYNVANAMCILRNHTIHRGYSITQHFKKNTDEYKNRLAWMVYDYVTIVFYLKEYIDGVWNDNAKNKNTGKYSSGQNKKTYEKFVCPAHKIIDEIVGNLTECEEESKSLTQEQKDGILSGDGDVTKHYAFIVDFDSKVRSGEIPAPKEAEKLITTILSDPGSVDNLMERMKAVNTENNDNLKQELAIVFKQFLDENQESLKQQYVKLNAEVKIMEKSMTQMQSDISEVKKGQKDIVANIDESKRIIVEKLTKKFNNIYCAVSSNLTNEIEKVGKKVDAATDTIITKINESKESVVNEFNDREERLAREEAEKKEKEDLEAEKAAKSAALEAQRIQKLKKWIHRDNVYIGFDVAIFVIMMSCLLIFHNDIAKRHYVNKTETELVLARDFEREGKYEEAALHNKAAFQNTLRAFNLDPKDNNLRRRLIYMYQWGKGTHENKAEAFHLAEVLKDVSPKDFGRYIYLKYQIAGPERYDSLYMELDALRQNDVSDCSRRILEDSLVRLTDAMLNLNFAKSQEIEDSALNLIDDYAKDIMPEAMWEFANLMYYRKKLSYSGKNVHFQPTRTRKLLSDLVYAINSSQAWKLSGRVNEKLLINEAAAKCFQNAILAGDYAAYPEYSMANYRIFKETNDSSYYIKFRNGIDSANHYGSKWAKFYTVAKSQPSRARNSILRNDSIIAPLYAVTLAYSLLSESTDSESMELADIILRRSGRVDINTPYLKAHRAFYEKDLKNYISYMQRAWEDSCEMAYICLGNYCYNLGELENAEYYFRQIIDKPILLDPYAKELAYYSMAQIALTREDSVVFQKYVKLTPSIKLFDTSRKDYENIIIEGEDALLDSEHLGKKSKAMTAYIVASTYFKLKNLEQALDWMTLAAYVFDEPLHMWDLFNIAFEWDNQMAKEWITENGYAYGESVPKDVYEGYRSIFDSTPKAIIREPGIDIVIAPYAFAKACDYFLSLPDCNDSIKQDLMRYAVEVDEFYNVNIVDKLSKFGVTENVDLAKAPEFNPYVVLLPAPILQAVEF